MSQIAVTPYFDIRKPVVESGEPWLLGGNTIGAGINKIGTIDNVDFEVIRNNVNVATFRKDNSLGYARHALQLQGYFFVGDDGSLIFEQGGGGYNAMHIFWDALNQRSIFAFGNSGNPGRLLPDLISFDGDFYLATLPNATSLATDATGKIIAGAGGGASVVSVNTAALTILINTSTLVPGQFYIVTDAEPSLYGGTQILLQAINTNAVTQSGHGLFFTPKYTGAGNGVFNPASTYAANDKTFWGGYVWNNIAGVTGTSVDKYTLDANWSLIPYNTTDYNYSWDIIKYNPINDQIYYREDALGNVVDGVSFSISTFSENSIKTFQWGSTGTNYCRQTNGCIDNINIKGIFNKVLVGNNSFVLNINLISSAAFYNIIIGENSTINSINVGFNSSFSDVLIGNISIIQSITIGISSNFNNITIDNNSTFGSTSSILIGNNSILSDIKLKNYCAINGITVGNNSFFKNIVCQNSCTIDNISIGNNSFFGEITALIGSKINAGLQTISIGNDCNFKNINCGLNSEINNIDLLNNCNFINISIGNNSTIIDVSLNTLCVLDKIYLNNNVYFELTSTTFLPSTTLQKLTIQDNCTVTQDISAATVIYSSFAKIIFSRQDDLARLSYYNNLDMRVIVNVNA